MRNAIDTFAFSSCNDTTFAVFFKVGFLIRMEM